MSDLWSHSHEWDNGYCKGHIDGYRQGASDTIEKAKKYIHKAIAHDGRNGWSAETWEHYIMVCLEQLKEQKNG